MSLVVHQSQPLGGNTMSATIGLKRRYTDPHLDFYTPPSSPDLYNDDNEKQGEQTHGSVEPSTPPVSNSSTLDRPTSLLLQQNELKADDYSPTEYQLNEPCLEEDHTYLTRCGTLPMMSEADALTSDAWLAPTTQDSSHPLDSKSHTKSNKEYPYTLVEAQHSATFSSCSRSFTKSRHALRRSTTVNFGDLSLEEESALEAEIATRRAARRASTRKPHTYADTDDEDDSRVMIGTRIAEGHRNYQLMYDMLTGIRIAVGRVSAKIRRDLTDEDFKAAHKLVFDITGNELTPGVKYDFKFKDYAPWVFRHLRERFHIDAADYMMSLTNKYILSELGSPGKSRCFFYYSRDYRFIIKTIHRTEHRFLRRVLKDYYQHVCQNPNTLLCRFYGLHRIKLPHGRKRHFVVMSNVFPTHVDIHRTYDLKGSTFGRFTSKEEIEKNQNAVLKDQNWLEQSQKIHLGPKKRELFLAQLERDVELLKRLNIMDYSLLVGVHDLRRGNSEAIRDHRLQVIKPRTNSLAHRTSLGASSHRSSKADLVRKALKQVNPVQVDVVDLPVSPSEERRKCIFYADNGGFQSGNESDEASAMLYFIGIIDILTPYNYVKKTEHAWKSITQDKLCISSVPPKVYGDRFLEFIRNAVSD